MHLLCSCCSSSTDYPLLEKLRNDNEVNELSSEFGRFPHSVEKVTNDGSICGGNSDSDDELLAGAEEIHFQSSRIDDILLQRAKIETAQRYGFAAHVADYPAHVLQDTVQLKRYSVVLHLCNTFSAHCALLDLFLEELAMRHVGTVFRRIEINQMWEKSKLQSLLAPFCREFHVDLSQRCSAGALLMFRDAALCGVVNSIEATFFTGSHTNPVLLRGEVTKVLMSSRVLHDEVPPQCTTGQLRSGYARFAAEESSAAADDEMGEEIAFCDDPRCARRTLYPHEHIRAGSEQPLSFTLPPQCIECDETVAESGDTDQKQHYEALGEFALSKF